MDLDNTATDLTSGDPEPSQAAPRVSQWLWRPWHAKLWWAAIGIYWTGKLASYWFVTLAELYETAVAGWLNIVLYPFTALLVLGVGFVRASMEHRRWEWGPPTHDQLFPKRSVGGLRDPYSDPLDPKSGMLYWRRLHPPR